MPPVPKKPLYFFSRAGCFYLCHLCCGTNDGNPGENERLLPTDRQPGTSSGSSSGSVVSSQDAVPGPSRSVAPQLPAPYAPGAINRVIEANPDFVPHRPAPPVPAAGGNGRRASPDPAPGPAQVPVPRNDGPTPIYINAYMDEGSPPSSPEDSPPPRSNSPGDGLQFELNPEL